VTFDPAPVRDDGPPFEAATSLEPPPAPGPPSDPGDHPR